MILTCPACTMRYLVSEGAVGPNGRQVRCAHCGHQWFQEAEEGLDEELFSPEPDLDIDIALIEDEDSPFEAVDNAGDDSADDFQSILQKELQDTPIPEGVKPIYVHEDVVLPPPSTKKAMKLPSEKFGGFATAAVIWAIVFGVLMVLQPQISRAWPPSNLLYNLIGLKPVPPGEGLSLNGLRAEMGEGKIHLTGDIINLKESEVKVPAVMASITDANDKVIDRILIAPPVARLKSEGRTSFDTAYPKIPDGAKNVSYAFSLVKVEPEKPIEKETAVEEPDYDHQGPPQNPAPHH